MADSELADLTATTTLATGDIFYVVRDPAGTPVDRKIAVENAAKEMADQLGAGFVLVDADRATRTAGSLTLNNSGGYVAVPSIGDLTLACATGDIVEFTPNALTNNEAVTCSFDVGTIVAAAVVNRFANTTEGIQGWHARDSVFTNITGGYEYVAQAGDIDSGTITLRFLYKTGSAADKTMFAASDRPLRISAKVWRAVPA